MDKRYGAKRSSQHTERRDKLAELQSMGLPEALAKAVASGNMPLNDALEQMAQAAQVERLMAKHGLLRSVAVQVAMGQMDLDTLLARRRLKEVVDRDRAKSCIQEGRRLAFATQGGGRVIGTITSVTAYELDVEDADGVVHHHHKLDLRYAYEPDDWKRVRKGITFPRGRDAARVEPEEKPQHRYNCSNQLLFEYMEARQLVRVGLLGEKELSGFVVWFAQYEFGLELRSGADVTVFRHALASVEPQ